MKTPSNIHALKGTLTINENNEALKEFSKLMETYQWPVQVVTQQNRKPIVVIDDTAPKQFNSLSAELDKLSKQLGI
jgi:hypothetical protein